MKRFIKIVLLGIIPACAGNTWSDTWPAPIPRDHPRVCGEHVLNIDDATVTQGSSPRVRGTRVPQPTSLAMAGIIPACAGNTSLVLLVESFSWDHPRVCGEHSASIMRSRFSVGSSPRVRGTLASVVEVIGFAGIIPACAGNTALGMDFYLLLRGSSPRVRGTLVA